MKRMTQIASVLIVALVTGCAGVTAEFPTREEIRGYRSVGRVKWQIPTENNFYFAVPHFTQGPRLKCAFPKSGECEISVYARDLRIDFAKRKNDFFSEMQPLLKDAVESDIDIRSYGSDAPVFYATLTDKRQREEYRYLTQGMYVRGPFVIRFYHVTNDNSGTELNRILKTVHSAEPIDAMAILAWKLSDYKAVCEERFPSLKNKNDAAFSASRFAKIDWLRLMQASDNSSAPEKMSAQFEKAKRDLADSLAKEPDEFQDFCESFPTQAKEAEWGLP